MKQFLESKGLMPKSVKIYLSIINKVIVKLGNSFTEKQLEDYMSTLNLQPSTYNLYRAVMNFYTKRKLGYELKFSKAKQNKFLPIEVIKEEFNKFLYTIPNIKHIVGFRLMYESGLRVNEVATLKKHDLELNKLTVRIRGKGNKDRYTILNKPLVNNIKELISKSNPNNQYLFQDREKGHITTKTFQERLKTAREDSKLTKKFTCHSFRHSFAINLLNDGVDIDIVRKLLGHTNIRTTQIYLQCRTINLTKLAERLSE